MLHLNLESNDDNIKRQETSTGQPLNEADKTPDEPTVNTSQASTIITIAEKEDPDVKEADDEETPNPCCAKIRPLHPLFDVASAIKEAADIGKSLWVDRITSLPIVITGAGAAFFSSIVLTLEDTKESFDDTCKIIKTRRLPRQWTKLSDTHETVSIGLSLPLVLWQPFSQAAEAYYFVNDIPSEYGFADSINKFYWSIFSGTVGGGAGCTNILTEGMENYKLIRDRIAGMHEPYQNTFSRFVSPAFGISLGAIKSFQDAIQSYEAMKSVFGVTSMSGKMLIAAPDLFIHLLYKLFFDSVSATNAMDQFFGRLQKGKFEAKELVAFSMVTALSVYLAFLKQPLNTLFYQNIAADFQNLGFNYTAIPEDTYGSLSWATFVEESILNAAALYHPMYHLVDKTTNKVGSFANRVYNYCYPPSLPPTSHNDMNERTPLLLDDDEAGSHEINVSIGDAEENNTQPSLSGPKISDHTSTLFSTKRVSIEQIKSIAPVKQIERRASPSDGRSNCLVM